MQRFTRWLDPKLDRFRSTSHHPENPQPKPAKSPSPSPYTPRTLEDFIGVVSRTPRDILDNTDRARLSAVMSFNDRQVLDLMSPKTSIVFVQNTEILGPLVLDRLYKSGFTNFPVIDSKEHIKGVIHTEALNSLKIKKAERADKYMDRGVHYLHTTDSLAHAVSEIERTNSYYFLVLDEENNLAGFFTTEMLLSYLLGK